MRIRPLQSIDYPAILTIESSSPSPWDENALIAEQNRTHALQYVIENDAGECCGWIALLQLDFEAEILKIAVKSSYRGQGFASTLLQETVEILSELGVSEIFLEVRESNQAAIALYRKFAFSCCGKRKKYYRLPLEDALLFQKTIAK